MPGILGGLLSVLGVWLATPEVLPKSEFLSSLGYSFSHLVKSKQLICPCYPQIISSVFKKQLMIQNQIYGPALYLIVGNMAPEEGTEALAKVGIFLITDASSSITIIVIMFYAGCLL